MRTRGLALQGKDETAGLPNVAVDVLEKRHLIRADVRAGARWYELVHDRLVDPILKSNQAWEIARQTPLRMTAKRWQETKSEALVYRDKALKESLAWAKAHPDEVEPYQQEFLQVSQRVEQVRARTRQITIAVSIGLAIGLVIMVVLAIAAFRGQRVAQQAQATAVAESDVRATAQAQAEVRRQEAEAAPDRPARGRNASPRLPQKPKPWSSVRKLPSLDNPLLKPPVMRPKSTPPGPCS